MTSRSNAPGKASPWSAPFMLEEGLLLPFDVAIERIEAAVRLGIDPSLGPIRAMLAELGHPERAYACLQVAGTNGKTSTSRYAAALLRGEGLRCGLYTSPHLVRYNERVEIDGAAVDDGLFARGVSWALAAWGRLVDRGDPVAAGGCTEFELLTAAAFVMYALEGVDAAVLEVGLGGRWDATSAADPVAVAVTGIGFDHMGMLGDTLGLIAGEKAGVILPGRAVVLGPDAVRPDEVRRVMLDAARRAGVAPTVVGERGVRPEGDAADLPRTGFAIVERPSGLGTPLVVDVEVDAVCADGAPVHAGYDGIRLLGPAYQASNVACALALATAFLARPLDPARARESVAACPVPGRFELLRADPPVIIDACHNPQSAHAFATAVLDAAPDRAMRPALLFGALADKDHEGIVREVVPLFDRVYVTRSTSPRALPARELAEEVERLTGVASLGVFEDPFDAADALYGESFVCCGTITLIGDIAAYFEKHLVN